MNIQERVCLHHNLAVNIDAMCSTFRKLIFCIQAGETALFKATWRGWVKISQLLIDAGIHVDAQDFVSWKIT